MSHLPSLVSKPQQQRRCSWFGFAKLLGSGLLFFYACMTLFDLSMLLLHSPASQTIFLLPEVPTKVDLIPVYTVCIGDGYTDALISVHSSIMRNLHNAAIEW